MSRDRMKTVVAIVISVVVLGIGYYVSTSFIETEKVIEVTDERHEMEVTESVITNEEEVEVEEGNRTMFDENEFPEGISEGRVQNAIHHMSHAKVYANKKWNHLEPSQERIGRLLDVIKLNPDDYEHSELYIGILEKWKADDFSQAVSDHNAIWNLQGGTIGKATRLLTETEEAKYRKKYFE